MTLMFNLFVLGAFAFVLYSLFSAMFFMLKDSSKSNRTVKALSFRIGASIMMFLVIIAVKYSGMLQQQ